MSQVVIDALLFKESSAAFVDPLKKNLQNIQNDFEVRRNVKRNLEFMFEDFPDTDNAATRGIGVFEEVTEDAAAIEDVEGKEVDEVDVRAKLDEGSKSNENDLNDLF